MAAARDPKNGRQSKVSGLQSSHIQMSADVSEHIVDTMTATVLRGAAEVPLAIWRTTAAVRFLVSVHPEIA